MKILLDMNFSPRWVSWLADRKIDAVHWSAGGKPDAPDIEILEYAAINKLIILTHDLDFGILLARSGLSGPSVIQTRFPDTSPESTGDQLIMAVRQFSTELAAGCLITLSENRQRIRLLNLEEQ
jgi:predicted nuclease of predicted toxin-antitoxin system